MRKLNQGHFYTLFQTEGGKKYTLLSGTFPFSPFIGVHPSRGQFPTALTLFRLGGGGGEAGLFEHPLRQNRDNCYTERAMTFKFSDFS